MGHHRIFYFYVIITTYLHVSNGCSIDGLPNWLLPVSARILDTYNGIIYRRSTSGIEAINSVTHRTEGLNGGPYVIVSLVNSELIISTHDNYKNYEDIETALSIGFTANFRCTDGSSRNLVFSIDITDTNNNDPVFKPSSNFELTIIPPVPPNFLLTNCISDIIVRDIDLTTERIDFVLEGSPLFEIAYDDSSTVPKEFKAALRTTTFIRAISEPITLTITATDVDRTGDPRRTATATVKVLADTQFELPDEPIFSQPFYIANYTNEHEFILQDSIYLRQGYDREVKFSLDGQFSEHFVLVPNGNQITFTVSTVLPTEVFQQREIYLIVTAEREYTSGANSMIVLQLPQVTETETTFSKVLYNGKLDNGMVSHETITISGYDGTNLQIIGDHESSFEVDLSNGNVSIRKLATAALPVGLTHIALTLQADRANAVLLLDIPDSESKVEATFNKVFYTGKIDNGVVSHEPIALSGYDGNNVQIIGAYESSFDADFSNGVVTIRKAATAVLPVGLTHIPLTLQAGRASAVLLLDVTDTESEIEATFNKVLYNGRIENGVVSHETITIFGYDGNNVQIIGAYESSFDADLSNGVVTIRKAATAVLPVGLTHIPLTLQAGRASAVLLLDVTGTESEIEATFNKVLYNGRIENGVVSHETITIFGYDGNNVQIIGAYESSFDADLSNGVVTIRKAATAVLPVGLTHIPLTLQAGRASAVLLLDVTGTESEIEATFNKVLYNGRIENGVVSHETITIFGYDGNNVQIIGAYESSFDADLSNGVVTIRKAATAVLPVGLTHIPLTLQAGRASAVLLLDVTDTESEIEATFNKVLYNGRIENGVVSHETITIFGYDGNNVQIIGAYESSFDADLSNGVVTIRKAATAVLPVGLTHIPLTLQAGRASAVLLLDVTGTESEIEATFNKVLYNGRIENGVVSHETITIFGYDGNNVQIIGAYESSFDADLSNGVVTIRKAATAVLPVGLTHIPLTLQAGRASAVLLLDVTGTESEIEATFNKVLYNGRIENGVVSHETITIFGYDGNNVQIIGAYESSFDADLSNGVVTIRKAATAVLPVGLTHIPLTLQAGRASAVLLLDVTDTESEIEATFNKVLYNGRIENGVVSHETITIFGYDGNNVQIIGAYESSFDADLSNGVVTIRKAATAVLPVGLTHIPLTLQAGRASAVLLLDVTGTESEIEATFNKVLYNGRIENGVVSHETITIFGYDGNNVQIIGAYESSFDADLSNGVVTIRKAATAVLPVGLTHIPLTLQAGRASAVLLLDVTDTESEIEATFNKVLYNGRIENGVVSHETITIFGYDGNNVQIIGAYESSFDADLSNGVVTIRKAATAVLPVGLTHIPLTLQAGRASAVLLLDVTGTESEIEATFNKVLYNGIIENGVVSHETITIFGYDGINVQIIGAYESSFDADFSNGVVTIRKAATAVLPVGLTHIPLTLQAGRASAVLLLDVTDTESEIEATFNKVLYNGRIENGVVSHETITIFGYDGNNVQIIGGYESSFDADFSNGVVTIRKAATAVLPVGLTHIALTLQAGRASAVLLLDVTGTESEIEATFNKVLYNGRIENGVVSHETITIFGYDGNNVQIIGGYESSFDADFSNGVVTIRKAATAVLPVGLTHIPLTLQAGRASAVLLLDVTGTESEIEATFNKVLYNGIIENGVVSHETITIFGYDGINVQIIGAYESSFDADLSNGVVTIRKAATAVLPVGLTHIPLTLQAGRASAVLLLDVTGTESEIEATFNKVLYNGRIENGVVSHETITIFGYDGINVQIIGAYESSFDADLSNGVVTIRKAATAVLPVGLTHIPLTLQAGRASAVLLLDVTGTGDSDPPVVTFSRSSYFLWVDINQSGVVGKVRANAENDENILYSLQVEDDNLRERISINNEGEILLSAAAQSGVYSFIVTATAQNSRVNATASVLLRVEALPECGTDIGLPPLIVLEKSEEEPHKNLVTLNQTKYKDCRYNILSSWPADQSWLYVDEEGLHARAIDREHESIAFMTLSQIQVELMLECDSDGVSVAKRSLNTEKIQLGSDTYGSNKWILADTITYNARRSFINLIVTDINDNSPIFVGKENEPIYVGFPVSDLQDIILPRALTKLKATDADIGENAALIYWSTEDNLAVAPQTGFVHVRNNALIENNSRHTVYATDLNGKGLNGSLDIVIRLLTQNQIAVITVHNAFLDDEDSILNELSEAIGYEIKILRAVVIPDNNKDSSRTGRDVLYDSGASLQLYVYGLRETQPVDVLRLTSDINNSNAVTVNVARVLSLEDHLESLEICPIPGRDTGLFVATIVLAVLLFIVIIVNFVWFILIKKYQIHMKWRKHKTYDEFNDTNSIVSQNNTMEQLPKVEIQSKPRLNIEELKRSERRLQEMLDIPIQEIAIEPDNIVKDVPIEAQVETILDIPIPMTPLPIVIQSIDKLKTDNDDTDDDDEFGEKKEKPRKSVVTFNENVEKIIHLEDSYEDSPEPNLEVYKF